MAKGFEELNDNDFATLKDAISWITALIAGADGKIDAKETEWAEKLTHIRTYAHATPLNSFYEAVGSDFSEKLNKLISNLPASTDERTAFLSRKLEGVNAIMSTLDNDLAVELYESYLSFAKHVAKVSGGFFGMMSISKEESALIGLSMIHVIESDEEE